MSALFVKAAAELSVETQHLVAAALRRVFGNAGQDQITPQVDGAQEPMPKDSTWEVMALNELAAFVAVRELLNAQSGRSVLAQRAIARRSCKDVDRG